MHLPVINSRIMTDSRPKKYCPSHLYSPPSLRFTSTILNTPKSSSSASCLSVRVVSLPSSLTLNHWIAGSGDETAEQVRLAVSPSRKSCSSAAVTTSLAVEEGKTTIKDLSYWQGGEGQLQTEACLDIFRTVLKQCHNILLC